jgi:tRNA-2-methylthio-N6-dimethylallyladenosine synthase
VLKRMLRRYTRGEYMESLARLRTAVPGLSVTTDVIVGFPGETDGDFAATEALMARVGYDSAFLFKYSAREGTRAYKWTDDVPEPEKTRRLERLIALQERTSGERNRAQIGRTVEVLVEGPAKRPAGWVVGKSRDFRTVVVPGPAAPGDLITARIEAATSHTLTGGREAASAAIDGRTA